MFSFVRLLRGRWRVSALRRSHPPAELVNRRGLGLGLLALSLAGGARPAAADFAGEIQPIFAARCYSCHGEKKQESGLRLDRRDSALAGGDHGPLVIPGKASDSLLVRVLTGQHPELARMPKKGDPLGEAEIGKIRAWIEAGAEWAKPAGAPDSEDARRHWAFLTPVRPSVPGLTAAPGEPKPSGTTTPLDALVAAPRSAQGLTAAPEADRVTLLRRVHFDLTGLPPTLEETDAFLADASSEAYAKVVERLLASPHYGERWARHWLDAARYADSDGFEKDKPRFVWAYRDWVIAAINRDLPYDRFVVEQIAGDLLPDATPDQRVATGYLRNAMLNEEGGVDPEQFRMEAMFDRMDAIGKGILGLTIQCGQCHSHKYDPLTQQEYYRLFAFLNNDHESSEVAYGPEAQMQIATLRREINDLEEGLRHRTPDWEKRMSAWEESVRQDQPEWQVVSCVNEGDNGERFYYYADGSIRAASYAPTQWTARFGGTNHLPVIGAFRLEQLTDPNLPAHGPGRSIHGLAALSEFKVTAEELGNPTNKVEVKFVKATADFANAERDLEPEFDDRSNKKRVYGPIEYAIDGKGDTAWGIDAGPGRRNQPRKGVFIPERPLTFTNGAVLHFGLMQNHGGWNSDDNQNHNLGRFRLSVTDRTIVVADPLPAAVREILRLPREQRSPRQIAAVFSYWRTTEAEFKEVNDQIEARWRQWPEGTPSLTLASRAGAGPGDEPRATQILKRGDWLKPGDAVTPGVPAFLHPLPAGASPDRLTFARWLVDRRSPTTARAFVNRVWQQYFGTGMVATSEDLGRQSTPPSHPELLDWLAVEFMEPTFAGFPAPAAGAETLTPWSLKHLHRLILYSATYRQSSRVSPEAYAKDPYNRWLARGSRLRAEAEVVRDTALAVSGLLNLKLGGPSLNPPAPGFLFQPPASYGPKVWKEETGADRYRRAVYTFRYRSIPYPVLQNFDSPNGDFSCVRRVRSNTPLQALTSLNEVLFMEASQALARKILESPAKEDGERIEYGFRRVLSRKPTTAERQELLALYERQKVRIAEGWINPHELATGKNTRPTDLPPGVTPTQLAAYTAVSRVLLNLDETITRE